MNKNSNPLTANEKKKLNELHDHFEVRVKSQMLNGFVPRVKDAVHSSVESALEVAKSLKLLAWEVAGFSRTHRQYHTVAFGKPGEN